MAIHGSDKQKVRPSGKRKKRKREKREKVERKRKN